VRKVRRMCRVAGVGVRFPFLDQDVAEFSAQIPAEILMKGGQLRAFYKQAMRGFLPQEILDKKKHGFGMPYDLWIKTHPGIRQVLLDNVAAFRQRRYCNPGFIDGLMKDSDGGDPRATGRVWDIMMLEMWLRERGLN
jgi:asparagine synthase (glutamine-hydrolysing)